MNLKTLTKKISAILTITIVGLTLLSSCSSDQKKKETDVMNSVQQTEASEKSDSESDLSSANLPYHLEECTAYSETFTHPMTGEELKKEVVGLDGDGLCEYKEQMPNGGLMECKFPEETRKVMAQYYEDFSTFGAFSSVKVTYTINGKKVENPLDEVMKNGTCTVSGY